MLSSITNTRSAVVLAASLLSACGSGSPGDISSVIPPIDPPPVEVDPVLFELVEATTETVHAAFAGETVLDDGSTLTCEKLVTLYQERIFAYNNYAQPNGGLPVQGVLNLSTVALSQARELDALYEQDGGIGDRYLHCMPVLLKDNYDTYDQPSTQGSYSMINHQAGVDSNSVAGLRDAGAVILGKANQDEFAFFTTGFSARAVQVSNPYNTQESPAGSSSGTGASLGSNFALGGTGSDTCQSIRHPSSVNGLVGIRPSIGTISSHGIFPLNHARDTGGPMTRSIRDSALMLTAMAGVDPRDPRTMDFPEIDRPDNYADYLNIDLHGVAGKNLGVVRDLGGNSSSAGTGEQGDHIDAAIAHLESLGAKIYDVYLADYRSISIGSSHYDMNEYFAQFDLDGGSSPRACVTDAVAQSSAPIAHGRSDVCISNTAATRGGIVETNRVGPRTAGLMALTASADPNESPSDEDFQSIVEMRDYVTAQMDVLHDAELNVVLDANGNTIRIDALLLSPGPSGGGTCGFGSTTQMGSIVVPVGYDSSVAGPADTEGRGVPRGMEIFVRRFDEGPGLGIAYHYEQTTKFRAAPILEADPTGGAGSVEQFNAQQEAAMAALTEGEAS